ncbi:elongation factor G [Gimibacter soli]|uniref:Elongation factor G n=1 Tax=Gimibacter soli TaxID=3024400 RepID=A0AAE9XSY8_9PROT|nr:elongation factor G [Gimibacter soli]WCL52623.1 elongation factor G [Gimibacter soli]
MTKGKEVGPRVVALVGPSASGKTTLLENLLFMSGTTRRQANGERVFGDDGPDARELGIGTELNIAAMRWMDDDYVFLDCPGSVEFAQEARYAVHGADLAIVVAEPEPEKILILGPLLHMLEEEGIPHMLFINKIDRAAGSVHDLAAALDRVSAVPAVLRHVPIRENGAVTGFVDLAAERAWEYRSNDRSRPIDMPTSIAEQVKDDRFHMLETIADFHDELMEELLEDVKPPSAEVYADLSADLSEGRIMPVMMGSGLMSHGLKRLMKAVRHEAPGFKPARARLAAGPSVPLSAYVMKTRILPHMGRMSISRVIDGPIRDGDMIGEHRVSGLYRMVGAEFMKVSGVEAGDVAALQRLEGVTTGQTLGRPAVAGPERLQPVYAMAISVSDRKEEAKMSESLAKLIAEDPALALENLQDTGELVLSGQGEIHMRAARIRLKERFGIDVAMAMPQVPYKETIRSSTTHHARYKKQTGGHGQFGDVVIEVRPQAPGTGFAFDEKITGGAIPRQYISSVEAGVRESLVHGPLGFPVVDVLVTLTDGSFHTVDSSDMAFKMAGRMAISQALPTCQPVLLEPIEKVTVFVPSDYTAKVTSLVSSRRGQILNFDARPGWPGWDQVDAHIPKADMQDLIIELRSLTQGSGTFRHGFDHLTELTGKLKDKVLSAAKERTAH